ncbi:nucleotidyl transferase AbiEii/AbiGii toxin family protein [Candidatus Poriferisocius sp.]|uniref:nucleotidyl transferase AbiEii/AbiGii toxin family protein n=1 Tax=Candidatus Poriferisocius sp. TaxID=3101276 RepID=UPI003B01B3CB
MLDAAFDVLLSEMHKQRLFEEFRIVFKGGTALRKLRFGHKSRFSFDLDFDVEEGADEIIAGEITGHASSGFSFEISERRGHSYLRITSDLLPSGAYDVKVDYSNRGCWLPSEQLRPLVSPALPAGIWDEQATIPTMRLEEQIAEKLSRWQSKRLVRDLHDIATAYHLIEDEALVAKMYVLKSHKSWSAMLASRRPQQAAMPLGEVTAATQPNHLALDDLVHPSMHSEADKLKKIKADLAVMASVSRAIDQYIAGSPLEELSADAGRLEWKTDAEIAALKSDHAANPPVAHDE